MNRESLKSLGIGAIAVVATFASLLGLLALVTGTGGGEGKGERILYKSTDQRDLALTVYKPDSWAATDQRTSVLWFFGGGWEVGSVRQFEKHCEWLADRGILAIAVDYRIRSTDGTTPFEAVKDARSAMRYLRANAKNLGIDPTKIIAAGGSAGAQLAAGCALFDGVDDESDDVNIDPGPNGLLLLGPLLSRDIPIVRRRTGSAEYDSLQAISPIEQLQEPLPPALILHGEADHVVPIASTAAFVEQAKQTGSPAVAFVRYPSAGHEFYRHGKNGNREFTDVLERAMRFFRKHALLSPAE